MGDNGNNAPEPSASTSSDPGRAARLQAEADKLLRLAEDLQEKCEHIERRLFSITLFALLLMLTLVSLGGSYLFIIEPESKTRYAVIFFAALYAAGMMASVTVFRYKLLQHLKREERALYEIVDMLREFEQVLSEELKLSTLERAEFRIRLSRFGIGNERDRTRQFFPIG